MATASDVAKLAGVSQSTVSYVMSGMRSISPDTRARVEAAMRELSYQPNAGARALAGNRTHVIGLVVRLPENTDLAALLPFIDTISAYCRERDYDVVLVTEDEGPAGLARLAGRSIVDAIVMMDIRRDDSRIETVRALDIPVVLIGLPDDNVGLDCVDVDVKRSARLAVEELSAAGTSHILLIGEGPDVLMENFGFVSEFAQTVRSSARRAGLTFELFEPDAEGWSGFDRFDDAVGQMNAGGHLGIIARTPRAIDIVMQLLLARGIVPGTDVSLVGLCTDSTAAAFRLPVTNVSPEPRDVSRLAMQTLFRRLEGTEFPYEVRLVEPRLTRRATTVPTATR